MKYFDIAFDDFIERKEYDEAINSLLSMIKISFTAGWLAAGGRPPQAHKVFELLSEEKKTRLRNLEDGSGIETDIKLDGED